MVNPIWLFSPGPAVTLANMLQRLAIPWMEKGLDLLFPPRCALCRDDLGGGPATRAGGVDEGGRVLLCPPCRRALASDHVRCSGCGGRATSEAPCRECQRRRHGCGGLAVLGAYGDTVREAVLKCKRPEGEPLARSLAGLIVARHGGTFAAWRIDVIVPVPMHWRRRMARGTSAADELAAGIAARLRVPSRRALGRRRATPMQNSLPVEKRRHNVADAFVVRGGVARRRVLLVDDVCTTGATLAACGAALLAGGAESVFAAVVAKADGSADGGDD